MAKKQKRKSKEIGFGYTVGSGPYEGQRVYILKRMFSDSKDYQKYKKVTKKSKYCKNIRSIAKDPIANKHYLHRKGANR